MKKGQIYEGVVEQVLFPNKGIVKVADEDGGTAVVKNTIPGQKISFSVKKVRKGKAEGRLLEILEKSPIELEEQVCEHFGACGGCTYLNLSYEEQLKLKEKQVKELLRPVLEKDHDFDEIWEGIKESPNRLAYRNKMEFSFGDAYKDGPLALGMHKRGSFHDIVTVSGCKIVDKDYNKILSCVLNYFSKEEIPFYHKMQKTGYLRHLLVRKGTKTEEILIDLVTTSAELSGFGYSKGEEQLLLGMVEELLGLEISGNIIGILHTYNDSVADAVKNDKTDILFGKDYFYEEILGLRFKISPFSFFQTNSLGAQVLYETAREFAADSGNDRVIYDLYSGTGTIAQMMAPAAKKVIGVEIVEEAVLAARENAVENGLDNCEFIAGDVLKVIDGIEDRPEFIVLDPPREGLHPKVVKKVGESKGCNEMIYISCKPTSLSRDLEMLVEYGYRVRRVCCVDMFPGTVHVETIVGLQRQDT